MLALGTPVIDPSLATATRRIEDELQPLYESPLSFISPDAWGGRDGEQTFEDWGLSQALLHHGPRGIDFAVREEVRPHLPAQEDRSTNGRPGEPTAPSPSPAIEGEGKKKFGRWFSSKKSSTTPTAAAPGHSNPGLGIIVPPLNGGSLDSKGNGSPTPPAHRITSSGSLMDPAMSISEQHPYAFAQDDPRMSIVGLAISHDEDGTAYDDVNLEKTAGRAPVHASYSPIPMPMSPTSSTASSHRASFKPSLASTRPSRLSSISDSSRASPRDGPSKGPSQLDMCLNSLRKRLDIDIGYLLQVETVPESQRSKLGPAAGPSYPQKRDYTGIKLLATTGLRSAAGGDSGTSRYTLPLSPQSSSAPSSSTTSSWSGSNHSGTAPGIPEFDVAVHLSSVTSKKGLYYKNPAVFTSMAKKLKKQVVKGAKKGDSPRTSVAGFPSGDPVARLQEALDATLGLEPIASGFILPVMEFSAARREYAVILVLLTCDDCRMFSVHEVDMAKGHVEKALWSADVFGSSNS